MAVILTIQISTLLFAALLAASAFAGFMTAGYIASRSINLDAEKIKTDTLDFAEHVRAHDAMMVHLSPRQVMENDKTINQLYDEFFES